MFRLIYKNTKVAVKSTITNNTKFVLENVVITNSALINATLIAGTSYVVGQGIKHSSLICISAIEEGLVDRGCASAARFIEGSFNSVKSWWLSTDQVSEVPRNLASPFSQEDTLVYGKDFSKNLSESGNFPWYNSISGLDNLHVQVDEDVTSLGNNSETGETEESRLHKEFLKWKEMTQK
jgi:hypothetical protein